MTKRKIYVAGHAGMVGSALIRQLEKTSAGQILTASRRELDLTNQGAVMSFLKAEKPDEIYIAAAKVGGILANSTYPADFIFDNLMIACNIVHAAYKVGVERLLFLGSSCIYPSETRQPIREEQLLAGSLEPSNEPYAIAKIAGIKLCQSYYRQYNVDYRCVMPTNLYGPGDNFHPDHSHVIPGLINRFHIAKCRGDEVVRVWGSGTPKREFLHVDDLSRACVHIMGLDQQAYINSLPDSGFHLNIGSGQEISIAELASLVSEVVGFKGMIEFDDSKPDGVSVKLMDSARAGSVGWRSSIDLRSGLEDTYAQFCATSPRRSS